MCDIRPLSQFSKNTGHVFHLFQQMRKKISTFIPFDGQENKDMLQAWMVRIIRLDD